MKAYILSGIFGAGKSTYAKRTWPNAVICSADDYFTINGGFHFVPSLLGKAHASCFRLYLNALQFKSPIVVCDNTNTTVEEISPYVLAADAFGYEPIVLTFNCAVTVAADRNIHNVPTNAIDRQYRNLRDRVLPVYWKHERIFDTYSDWRNTDGAP